MLWLPPLDHFGRPIPVPSHHLFSWRTQGVQLLLSLLVWMAFMVAVTIVMAVFETRDPELLIRWMPKMAVIAASFSVLITLLMAAIPPLTWPWARREYGLRLEARIEQMTMSELCQQIEQCDRELEIKPSSRQRRALVAWRNWLDTKRVARTAEITPQVLERLILKPARRKLFAAVACGGPFLAVGFWIIWLAIAGGDGGTGVKGFSGPNAVWTKSFIGSLLVIVTAIPLIEAFTVRVVLTAVELRKRAWGRTLWSVLREDVLLVSGYDGCWDVLDARTQKRLGELNPHHFEDGQLLALIGQLRPAD